MPLQITPIQEGKVKALFHTHNDRERLYSRCYISVKVKKIIESRILKKENNKYV